jgi:hypothetical protein
MAFKNESNSRKTANKITKSSILENNQTCEGKSSPLFFGQKPNKKLSTKETFYQYLFIQSFLKTNELRSEGKISFADDGRTINNGLFMTDKKSQILHKLNIVSNQRLSHRKGTGNYQKYNLKNGKGIHDQIFITYKKSFICYWLLPLLGLIGTSSTKLFHFGQIYSLPKNDPNLGLNILKNKENFLSRNNSYANISINEPTSSRALPSASNSSEFYDFSLLLSKNVSYKEDELLSSSKYTHENNILKHKNASESLLLNLLNLSTNKSSENEFKKLNNLLNIKDFNLLVLNKKQKQISKLKWYWFDLFFQKQNNIFPNKVFNFSNSNKLNTSNEFFSSFKERRKEEINKFSLFISSVNNNKFKPADFKSVTSALSTDAELGQILPISPWSIKGCLFPSGCFQRSSPLAPLRTLRSKGLLYEVKLEEQSFSWKLKKSLITLELGFLGKPFQNKSLNSNIPSEFLLKNNNHYLVGIIKKNKTSNKNLIADSKEISYDTKGPYNSLKKTNFLLDQLELNQSLLSKIAPWVQTPQNFEKINFGHLLEIKELKKERAKTILLIFKDKKNSLKKTINLSVKTKNNSVLGSENLISGDIKNLIFSSGASRREEAAPAVDLNTLYDFIFETLKKDLDLIIESKSEKLLENRKPNHINMKKLIFSSGASPNEILIKNKIIAYAPDYTIGCVACVAGGKDDRSIISSLNTHRLKNKKLSDTLLKFNINSKLKWEKDSVKKINNQSHKIDFLNSFEFLLKNFSPGLKVDLNETKLPILTLRNSITGGNFMSTYSDNIVKTSSFINQKNKNQPIRVENKLNNIGLTAKEPKLDKVTKNNIRLSENQVNTEKNSFIYLSKYMRTISNKIKTSLSPYKYRLTYLPEIQIYKITNSFNPRVKNSTKEIFNRNLTIFNKVKLKPEKSKFEKVFISYLSKSKKGSNMDLASESKKISKPSFFEILNPKKVTSPLNNYIFNKGINHNILKLKSKMKLSDLKTKYLIQSEKNKKLINQTFKNNHNKKTIANRNFLTLSKNRIFLNKVLIESKMNLNKQKDDTTNKVSTITKNQTQKIKRRLKKMKCETRRRKKRKIFFPRPNWITFSMYKKFLNSRLTSKEKSSASEGLPKFPAAKHAKQQGEPKAFLLSKNPSKLNNFNKKANQSELNIKLPENFYYKKLKKDNQNYSHWLSQNQLNFKPIKPSFALSKNTKDFYLISSKVFGDLKRVLMKSNWLRSYLNPYLSKVKMIFNEMQNSSKNLDIYLNLRSLLVGFYGINIIPFSNSAQNMENTLLNEKSFLNSNLAATQPNLSLYLNVKNFISESQTNKFFNSLPSAAQNNWARAESQSKNLSNPLLSTFDVSMSAKLPNSNILTLSNRITKKLNRETTINIFEYNRIIYQRIQRIILNIRENFNLNGQIKNRSKTLGKNIRALIKRDYTKRDLNNGMPVNQNALLWSKIVKNNVLKFGKSLIFPAYEESSPYNNAAQILSRNNFYWSLNKSYTFINSNFNSSFPKKLWEIYKTREISKSNQTKKIVFNLFMKYNNLFNTTNKAFNGVLDKTFLNTKNDEINNKNILDPVRKDSVFFEAGSEETKFSRFFTKNNIVSDNPVNYTFLDDQLSKNFFTLPAKVYTEKSNQKLINIETKLKLLGLYSRKIDSNYKTTYFRFLKNELLKEKNNFYTFHETNSFPYKKATKNRFQNYFSSFANKNKMGNNSGYWWSFLKMDLKLESKSAFKVKTNSFSNINQYIERNEKNTDSTKFPLTVSNFNDKFIIPSILSSFLFHFCAIISFISLGGIRTLIKFYFILLSKTSKIIGSVEGIIRIFPKQLNKNLENNVFLDFSSDTYVNSDESLKSAKKNKLNNRIKKRLRFELNSKQDMLLLKNSNRFILKNIKTAFLQYLKMRSSKITIPSINFNNVFNQENSKILINTNNNTINTQKTKPYTLDLKQKSKFLLANRVNSKTIQNLINLILSLGLFSELKLNKTILQINSPNQNSLNKLKLFYNIKLAMLGRVVHTSTFYIYLLLLKSVDILAVPASLIYKFFEKPGEYVVDNLAYSFLVEWSADLIATIPETLDISQAQYFEKINRYNTLLLLNSTYATKSLFNNPFILNNFSKSLEFIFQNGIIYNSIIKRILNVCFLSFVQQLAEPDLDYINRQKKAQSIWDIWGEYLKTIAEENSINIYELTTDKEEQIKLLSKYEEALLKDKDNKRLRSKPTNSSDNFLISDHFKDFSLFNIKKNHSITSLRNKTKLSKLNNFKKQTLVKKSVVFATSQPKVGYAAEVIPGLTLARKVTNSLTAPFKNQLKNNFISAYSNNKLNNNLTSWSVSQFLSYKGKDSDLFIDLHPPRNFSSSAASLKYSFSVQHPIGSIVCQIFSGIFYKQISKNILVLGSPGIEKSLLIQAIAGETELKIITDSAYRYAMVYRGVAVGIKLLKDVFEALSLHTPCIFLMEDIHAIGERRPFLIDESTPNSTESTYNKNKSMQSLFLKEKSSSSREGLYKSNKHLLTHYKKAYKEPRGLATNHFSFTFLFGDFLFDSKLKSSKLRNNEIKLSSALSIQVMKKENQSQNKQSKNQQESGQMRTSADQMISSSSLLINKSNSENLSPPTSSPFSVLILKEATKLKHKKTVKEIPWFGLPGEQYSLISKYNYSIRVKVALLAELVLSNLSVKLDMITDLLVIIDSVKSNRGFVVFATTHIPYILDPALRRPGRFDETISLPLIPAIYSRWVNYRSNVQYLNSAVFTQYSLPFNTNLSKGTTLDLTRINFSLEKNQFVIDKLINYIYIRGFNLPFESSPKLLALKDLETKINKKNWKHLLPIVKQKRALSDLLTFYSSEIKFSPLVNSINQYSLSLKKWKQTKNKIVSKKESKKYSIKNSDLTSDVFSPLPQFPISPKAIKGRSTQQKVLLEDIKQPTNTSHSNQLKFNKSIINKEKLINKQFLEFKSKQYSNASKSLIFLMVFKSNILLNSDVSKIKDSHNNNNFSLKWPSMLKDFTTPLNQYSTYLSLFNSDKLVLKLILMSLISGKLGENFAISKKLNKKQEISSIGNLVSPMEAKLVPPSLENAAGNKILKAYPEAEDSVVFNFDNAWKNCSALLFNYIQKRQCSALSKNIAFSSTKLISFNNKYSLMEPPNPPISNILLPAKRYENYKRTFNQQIGNITADQPFSGSISEKLQLHQQQRLLKRLYKYPIKEFFKSHILKGKNNTLSNLSNFNNSYLILGPLEKTNLVSLNKLSNVNWCFRNILYNRHKTYLTNQWWNAQQGEHNAETTFLSDIDWRYTFVQSIGDIQIDFPDSEQFYNPRNRRWMLTNGDWNYWSNSHGEMNEIYFHYIYECFTKTYSYLDKNREIIDFYVEYLHQGPLDNSLKERILLNLYKRFLS